MSDTVFADTITNVSYAHGVLRVSLGRQIGDSQTEDAGTLILPINQASQFINSLGNSLKQLQARVNEIQQNQSGAAAAEGSADAAGEASKELHFGDA